MKSPLAIYQEHLERGELAYQVDGPDERPVFFPRVLSPVSGNTGLAWRVSGGEGTVYATTVMHYKGEAPLNLALVDLDEGFRMMSRVEGLAAEEVRIGMRVRLRVLPAEGARAACPVFTPVAEA